MNLNYIEISIEEKTSLDVSISVSEELSTDVTVNGYVTRPTQEKSVTPTQEQQTVLPDDGYYLSSVTVEPIPENYGLITYNGYSIMVS